MLNLLIASVVEKKDSMMLPANKIRDAAKATAIREIASQKAQFRKFGIMADWSPESTYRTLGAWKLLWRLPILCAEVR